MRRELTVIATQVNGYNAVHFTDTKLQGEDLWFPIEACGGFDNSVRATVEKLMVCNGVAHNVVHLEELKFFTNGPNHFCADYRVIYNMSESS